ncbi:alpha/beta hydrolase fold domain-containing protein [bacterium]|nr:alpha/beta hydrolase fold domain-containing protein [bacterium]
MPLHPQCQAFLDQFAALNIPPLDQLPLDQIRALSVPVPGEPEPVAVVEDRLVSGPGGAPEIPVRVYQPNNGEKPRAGLIFYHGGGWVIGTLNTYGSLCHLLANAGDCVVVSVDYRLAPEHRFPAAFDDSYAATVWVRENAAELGIDPERIVVCGDSAGGNLAAAVCLLARDRGSIPIAAQVLVYPITNDDLDTPSYREFAEGYMLTRRSMAWFWQQYLERPDQSADIRCSPLKSDDLSGLPPALVLSAEYDVLRDESEAYAARLRDAGVTVTLDRYDGMIHGFLRRTDLYDRAREAVQQISEFIRGV